MSEIYIDEKTVRLILYKELTLIGMDHGNFIYRSHMDIDDIVSDMPSAIILMCKDCWYNRKDDSNAKQI